MKKTFVLLTCLTLSTSGFAMFCPKNFNQINLGDTIEQVEQQCGKPDFIRKSQSEDNGPQEWNFYAHPQMKRYTETRTNSGAEASVKVAVALNNGKVVNISANGMSLAATTICGGRSIAVGDTADSVKNACGDPVFINKSNLPNKPKPDEIITYKYSSTPPVILTFVNGKLTERQ